MEMDFSQLCNDKEDDYIRFSVWTKKDKLINEVHTTINEIVKKIEEERESFTSNFKYVARRGWVQKNGECKFSAQADSELILTDWKVRCFN